MAHFVYTIRDYDNKTSDHSVEVEEPDGTAYDDLLTQGASYQTALDGIVLGNIGKRALTVAETQISNLPAGSVWAQRQAKWEVHYHDVVTLETYQREIPCPDLTLLEANSKRMNITSGAGLTWKNAFQSIMVSPNGNGVVVDFVQQVGRNLS